MIKLAYGYDKANISYNVMIEVGNKIKVLNDYWTIDEIYKEELTLGKNDKINFLNKLWYKENFVYVCHNKDNIVRMIIVRGGDYVWVKDVNYSPKEYDNEATKNQDNYNKTYLIQSGCKLVKIK